MGGTEPEFLAEYARIINEENLKVGDNVGIDDFVLLNACEKTVIGDNSCIHSGSKVVGGGSLDIGDNVAITYNCVLVTGYPKYTSHMSTRVPKKEKDTIRGEIRMGDESFLGSNSIVMPDTEIGEGAVVASMSYIDEDVPDWTIRYPDGSTAERERFEKYE